MGEYEKETKLAFEKEVLGRLPERPSPGRLRREVEERISHEPPWTSRSDEETGRTKVRDGVKETIGGMITDKTIKYTKNNKTMAFLTVEDLAGTVEVVVFPRDYEKYQRMSGRG